MRAEAIDISPANHSEARMRHFPISGPTEREITGMGMVEGCLRETMVSYTCHNYELPFQPRIIPHTTTRPRLEAVTRKTEIPCQLPGENSKRDKLGQTKSIWFSHKVLQKDNV